ncbi:MAG: GH92 family glycosyl hydrolase [Bacteroidota bacterium]
MEKVVINMALSLAILACCSLHLKAQDLVGYVQPLSGTAGSTTVTARKHSEAGSEKNANTIPAVGLPFGMTQWTAQTSLTENKCIPPYFYKDQVLRGFRGSHWLSGSCTQDYGSFTLMPVTSTLKTLVKDYSVRFSHSDETTTPAYYQLVLPQQHITAEMTSTLRCGIMRFTMQQDDSLYVLITPNSDRGEGFVQVDAAKGEVWGYNPVHRIYQGWGNKAGFNGWFFMKFEKKILRSGTYAGAQVLNKSIIADQKDIGAFAGFLLKKDEQLVVKIGTSFSSLEGAKKNLQNEIGAMDFKTLLVAANAAWKEALGQVTVETGNEKDKRIFYTAMYHALQHPRLYSDVDGTYPAFAGSGGLKKMKEGHYYDDFSMWDIYRAQLPLVEILQPAKVNSFVQSMILKAEQGGWLPIFPCWNSFTSAMIGDHGTAFIASAYNKGIRNYDIQKAYKVMRKNAFEVAGEKDYNDGMGRRALPSYLEYGFIPMEDSVPVAFHKKEQVSRTLEYAFDDYALSLVAKGLGKNVDYQTLSKRSLNYRNVFDKKVGMMRGKYSNGQWYSPFSADTRELYITEGTPRQYSFYVPHDVPGLAQLMGGEKMLENALDSLFAKDEYWHGNEPGHQIPFMYNYTATPYKTQQQVRKILAEEYSDGPGGLSGNDDAGQMSAWYVFASMGFYPVDPVSDKYLLCSPLFDNITMEMPGGKFLRIITHKTSAADMYISRVALNGKGYDQNFITHDLMSRGGILEIWLQDKPAKWGSKTTSRPPGLPASE